MQSKIETDADPPTDILVVEDDVLLRMALAGELRSAGFNVIEARDGEEALTILLTANNIGLVVADADLRGAMDGIVATNWPSRQRYARFALRNEARQRGIR